MITNINDNNFEQTISSTSELVLIDFGATWCGPCKRQEIILDKFEYPDAHIFAIDVDDAPKVAAQFKIRSVPTLLFLKDRVEVERKIGLTSASDLKEILGRIK